MFCSARIPNSGCRNSNRGVAHHEVISRRHQAIEFLFIVNQFSRCGNCLTLASCRVAASGLMMIECGGCPVFSQNRAVFTKLSPPSTYW